MARRLRLGAFRVEPRRGRHVEAFCRPNSVGVVHQHEGRGRVAGTLNAGRSMGLVAQDDIEYRRAVVLRPFHDAERVIGAKDHG